MYRYAARANTKPKLTTQFFKAGTIDFSGGFAFPGCLPDASKEAVIAATQYRSETMQYIETLGLDEMRDFVVDYVAQEGVICKRENVLITNGAKHGLDLACRVLLEPGDPVIVTGPTYMTALKILRTFEVGWIVAAQDEEGIDVAALEDKLAALAAAGKPLPKLLFDVPDFHNPTGVTTTAVRRKRLVDLAKHYNFIIVEDDPYRKIRFEGENVPPIKSYDDTGHVIAVGTVSKILAPGLRIGWAIADADLINRMAGQKSDGGTSPFAQRIIVEMNKNGQIAHHIREITKTLRKHRDAMCSAFANHIPDIKIRMPEGGYYLWAELPKDVNSDTLAGLAAACGVKVYSGTTCFPVEPKLNFLRLCYSYVTPGEIEEGMNRLRAAYDRLQNELDDDTAETLASHGKNMATY